MLRDMKLVQMLGLSDVLEISVSELRKIEIGTSMRFRKLLIWQIAICESASRKRITEDDANIETSQHPDRLCSICHLRSLLYNFRL
jgi:hypothetical protein